MRDDFAIFILTHGRPYNVVTARTLKECGNTNRVYYVIDNEDKYADRYYWNFGKENVIMFDKYKKSLEFDTMDQINNRDRRAIVYARNACFDIAEDLGLTYFLELDDDYTTFRSRVYENNMLSTIYVRDFDAVVDATIDFLETSNARTVAFSQTGDFIGGVGSKVYKERVTRKAMNSFFCKTERRFDFVGRINEDVNTYVLLGLRGEILFTVADIALNQLTTQKNSGGMSELYLDVGTYVKSFFTVITSPASVKIAEMGDGNYRIHHLINWEHTTPKIVSSRFKKEE